jgi:glutamine amidotransferase PdxT
MKKGLFSIVLILVCTLATAQSYKQYTLYIFSFTKYILWPDAYNQGDFEIHVLGDSPLYEDLKVMAQMKKVGDRAIKLTKLSTPAEIKKCNILFVPAGQSDKLAEVLQKVGTQSILIITEQAGLGVQGSCVNFITKDGKLSFELNQSALTRQNLKASVEIIRYATTI